MHGTKREVHAVMNPAAANGRAGRRWPAIALQLRRDGLTIHEHRTQTPRHATQIAHDLVGRGAREILAVGGDGTVNEIVNGIMQNRSVLDPNFILSILPLGTGRDLARNLGIFKVSQAIAALQGDAMSLIDLGRVDCTSGDSQDERWFINVADCGLGAKVAGRVNRSSKLLGGFAAYMLGALREVMSSRPMTVRITIDQHAVHDGPIALVVIANGKYYGGGMMPAPEATMDDGQFDIVILQPVSRLTMVTNLLPRVYAGTHVGHSAVEVIRGRSIRIEGRDDAIAYALDGEPSEARTLDLEIKPAYLRVRTLR